jgi:glycosyltransferase involved in cell wall biosynthesis
VIVGQPSGVISVVLPTHNRCKLLARAIESVLRQTYSSVELIVVDDASTDETDEVLRSFSDTRIRYVRHDQNRGGSAARNTGIEVCTGEFVAFLDDDDEYVPQKLEFLHAALVSAPEAGLAYSQVRIIGVDRDLVFPHAGPSGNVFLDYLGSPFFITVSTLIRREVVVTFDESLPRWQDVDFHLRVLMKTRAVFLPRVTAIVHWDNDRQRITLDADALVRALPILEDRYFREPSFGPLNTVHARFLRHAGATLIIENGALALGRALLRRSLRMKPDYRTLVDHAASYGGVRFFAATVALRRYLKLMFNGS